MSMEEEKKEVLKEGKRNAILNFLCAHKWKLCIGGGISVLLLFLVIIPLTLKSTYKSLVDMMIEQSSREGQVPKLDDHRIEQTYAGTKANLILSWPNTIDGDTLRLNLDGDLSHFSGKMNWNVKFDTNHLPAEILAKYPFLTSNLSAKSCVSLLTNSLTTKLKLPNLDVSDYKFTDAEAKIKLALTNMDLKGFGLELKEFKFAKDVSELYVKDFDFDLDVAGGRDKRNFYFELETGKWKSKDEEAGPLSMKGELANLNLDATKMIYNLMGQKLVTGGIQNISKQDQMNFALELMEHLPSILKNSPYFSLHKMNMQMDKAQMRGEFKVKFSQNDTQSSVLSFIPEVSAMGNFLIPQNIIRYPVEYMVRLRLLRENTKNLSNASKAQAGELMSKLEEKAKQDFEAEMKSLVDKGFVKIDKKKDKHYKLNFTFEENKLKLNNKNFDLF